MLTLWTIFDLTLLRTAGFSAYSSKLESCTFCSHVEGEHRSFASLRLDLFCFFSVGKVDLFCFFSHVDLTMSFGQDDPR